MRRILNVLILAALMSAGSAHAVEVKDLFTGLVAVADQSPAAVAKAQEDALKQVLVRATGSSAVVENKIVQEQLGRATEYLLQYSFVTEGQQQMLSVVFDQDRIERLLRQANEAQWGARRPLVLLWWVREENGGRSIVADAVSPQLRQPLRQQAMVRGVPLILPLMDLDDSLAVNSADLWGQFSQPVVSASVRYRADLLVMAKSYAYGEGERMEWQLLDATPGGDSQPLFSGTLVFNGAPLALVDELAEKLASRYAVKTSESESDTLEVTITGLNQLADMAAVVRQLGNMAAVSRVELVRLRGRAADYRLYLLGNRADVLRALDLDPHFVAGGAGVETPPPAVSAPPPATATDNGEPQTLPGGITLVPPQEESAAASVPTEDAPPPVMTTVDSDTAAKPTFRWVP